MITFNHDNFSANVAYIVENDVLVHAILKELEPFDNITVRNDAKIEKILLERDGATYSKVQLANGDDFSAELLVCNQTSNDLSINLVSYEAIYFNSILKYLHLLCFID